VDNFIIKENELDPARLHQKQDMGHLQQIRQKTFCPLCRLIVNIADRPLDQRLPSREIAEDSSCYLQWVIDGQEEQFGGGEANAKAELIPRTLRLLVYSEPQTFKDGYLVLLGSDAPSPLFFGRRVSTADLDVALIRRWLSACEKKHGARCERSLVPLTKPTSTNHPFRVIDVKQMCIVEAPEDCRYIALSYLWGPSPTQLFMTTSDNLRHLSRPQGLERSDLPRTIQDAVDFANAFGEQYLWVDSLCLVHDQQFQYHDADKIYAQAALTVVAASGHDANAGLPGVRKGSRTFRQEIEEIKPGLRLMVSHLVEGRSHLRRAFSFCASAKTNQITSLPPSGTLEHGHSKSESCRDAVCSLLTVGSTFSAVVQPSART
jgi:Heterokaryon incompatibility protein (HET)